MIENQERFVSSVSFSIVALPRDAVEPHAADAAQQRAVARERHAERTAADMGEDLLPGIVRREEAHDVAGAVADIDVVVVVEDDVLRPVDAVEADRLDRTQPVVERIGRIAVRGGRGRQLGIGWRHIDLRQELVPVLQPAHVDRHRRQQHHAEQQRAAASALRRGAPGR